ncbi:MAG: hypothetical protein KAX27_05860, partial [Candidatus Aminicenantes bacterium]|nr:hypothetical protein [Candidatus Aminicenantes bacterium]
RWLAAGVEEAEVQISYENSGIVIGYGFRCRDDHIFLDVHSSQSNIIFHVLLPEHKIAKSVCIDGKEAVFKNFHVEKSNYADFDAKIKGDAVIKIRLCPKLA